MSYVKKCVQIQANWMSEKLCYKLCPSTEFSSGRWQIAISSVCCEEQTTEINNFVNFTTNFSVNEQYSTKGERQLYEQPLAFCYIKLRKTRDSSSKQQTIFYTPMWFDINRISDELYIHVWVQ